MAAQVEVKLGRVCDCAVHRGACWDVAALPDLRQRGDRERSLTDASLTRCGGCKRGSGGDSHAPARLCRSRTAACGGVSGPRCRWSPAGSPPPGWCRPSWWRSAPATPPETQRHTQTEVVILSYLRIVCKEFDRIAAAGLKLSFRVSILYVSNQFSFYCYCLLLRTNIWTYYFLHWKNM